MGEYLEKKEKSEPFKGKISSGTAKAIIIVFLIIVPVLLVFDFVYRLYEFGVEIAMLGTLGKVIPLSLSAFFFFLMARNNPKMQARHSPTVLKALWLRKFSKVPRPSVFNTLVDDLHVHGVQVYCLADQSYSYSPSEMGRKRFRSMNLLASALGNASLWIFALPLVIIHSVMMSRKTPEQLASYHSKMLKVLPKEKIYKAIQKPRKKTTEAIFRARDDEWKDVVEHFIDFTDIVIIEATKINENIRWEIEACFRKKGKDGIIFLVPVNQQGKCDERLKPRLDELYKISGEQNLHCFGVSSATTDKISTEWDTANQLSLHICSVLDKEIENCKGLTSTSQIEFYSADQPSVTTPASTAVTNSRRRRRRM